MPVTVMLADDHAVVRDGLRALLEGGHDLQVIGVAGNGREAVAEAQRLRPDVVIMDIAMPELDGVEATRRIVERCPETRVLILSMYLSAEHIHRALQAGAQGYVLKESAGEEVVEAIRALRAGKRYLSHRITETVIDDYLRRLEPEPARQPLLARKGRAAAGRRGPHQRRDRAGPVVVAEDGRNLPRPHHEKAQGPRYRRAREICHAARINYLICLGYRVFPTRCVGFA